MGKVTTSEFNASYMGKWLGLNEAGLPDFTRSSTSLIYKNVLNLEKYDAVCCARRTSWAFQTCACRVVD